MAMKELKLDAIGDLDEGAARLIVNAALAAAIHAHTTEIDRLVS